MLFAPISHGRGCSVPRAMSACRSPGPAMNKGLTFRMGQTHVNRCTDELLHLIEDGQIDPSFVITHTASLEMDRALVQYIPK